jgi:DNA invertase Pin-like site-specific DNA recombinase
MTPQRPEKLDRDVPQVGTKVAIYCRTATWDADIDEQEAHLRHVAERHGWQIVSAFQDRAQSGRSRDREGLKLVCAQALHPGRPFNHILTTAPSRISRDIAHYNQLCETLSDRGVVFVFSDVPTSRGGGVGSLSTVFETFGGRERAVSQWGKWFDAEDKR